MGKLWIDIEDLNNKYEIGFIFEKNKTLKGYEFEVNEIFDIVDVLKDFNPSEVFFFDGNDTNYIFNNLINACKEDDKAKDIYFKNVGLDYKIYLEGSKLQMTKNADIARAFGINIDFAKLHRPLYDIQLTYCAHHNFMIDDEHTKKDKIFDSFFTLTNKFDILWKVLKKFNVPRQFVNVKIVKPSNPEDVYFVELKERSYEDKYLVFTKINDLQTTEMNINKENIANVVNFFKTNFTVFVDSQQQSNLSRHIWETQYMDFNTRKLNSESFAIIKDLHIFMSLNISRFKLAMDSFNFDTIKEKLGPELTLDHLKKINNIN